METQIPTLRPGLPAARAAIDEQALAELVEQALDTLGRPQRLTAIVNDPHRHTDSARVLRILARRLPAGRVRILVAAGSHRFDDAQRRPFEALLRQAMPAAEIAWHDARAEALMPVTKRTWRGHPWLLERPPLLGVGSVEPHYFAGFTGAHKTLTIGCAAWSDIQANHAAALDAASRPAALAGNPVFEGIRRMLAALAGRQRLAAVNLLQCGDRVLAAAAGEPLAALDALVPAATEVYVRRIDRPADGIVAEATGPLGRTFYQADKAIKNNEWAVRDGGALILVAACSDGIGQDLFVSLLRRASTALAARRIVARRGYRLGDHKAVRLRSLTDAAGRAVRLFVVSEGLTEADARVLALTKAASVREALSAAGLDPAADRIYRLVDAANLCVLPEGR